MSPKHACLSRLKGHKNLAHPGFFLFVLAGPVANPVAKKHAGVAPSLSHFALLDAAGEPRLSHHER
jgi:hypothetical protein